MSTSAQIRSPCLILGTINTDLHVLHPVRVLGRLARIRMTGTVIMKSLAQATRSVDCRRDPDVSMRLY